MNSQYFLGVHRKFITFTLDLYILIQKLYAECWIFTVYEFSYGKVSYLASDPQSTRWLWKCSHSLTLSRWPWPWPWPWPNFEPPVPNLLTWLHICGFQSSQLHSLFLQLKFSFDFLSGDASFTLQGPITSSLCECTLALPTTPLVLIPSGGPYLHTSGGKLIIQNSILNKCSSPWIWAARYQKLIYHHFCFLNHST